MADKPEDPNPAASDGDPLKREQPGAPPEVDVEIVEDGYRRPAPEPSAAAIDSERDSGSQREDAPPAPAAAAKGPFGLSPGLMLLVVLAAVLIIGFVIWRLAGGGEPAESAKQTAPSAAPAESQSPPSTSTIRASPLQEAQPAPDQASPRPATDPGKIANTNATAAKENAAEINPAEAPVSSRGLPPAPPPATGGNEALQNAAKNAAKALTGPDTGDAIDLGESEPADASEPEPETADSPETAAAAAPDLFETEEPPAAQSEPEASSPVGDKIANELDEMKSALAAARAQNAQQAGEIAAMRDSFQEALLERDRQAGAAIASLSERLDKIQSESATAPRGREAAASLALVALQRALDSGAPYQAELDVLARLAPGRPALESLRAHADTGAPTLLALKADFPAAARAARAAAKQAKAAGPLAVLWARLETLVSIRPARPIAGADAGAVISRAEYQLGKDMLAPAVAELEVLTPPAADAFSHWLADARARLTADQAITAINAALLADFVE